MTKVEAPPSLSQLKRRLQGIDKGLVKFGEITSTQGRILFASKLDPQNLNGNPAGTLVEIGKRRKRVVTAIEETLQDRLLAQREITTQGIESYHNQTLRAQILGGEGYLSPDENSMLKPQEQEPLAPPSSDTGSMSVEKPNQFVITEAPASQDTGEVSMSDLFSNKPRIGVAENAGEKVIAMILAHGVTLKPREKRLLELLTSNPHANIKWVADELLYSRYDRSPSDKVEALMFGLNEKLRGTGFSIYIADMKIPVKLGLWLPKGIEIEQSEEPRDEVLTSTPEIQVVDDISGTTNEEFIEGPSTPQEDETPPEKDVVKFTKKESVLYELLKGSMEKGLSPDEISEQFKERFPDMDLAEIRYGLFPKILKSLREKLRIDGEDIENTAHQGKNASYILVRSTNLESFHEVNVEPIEQEEPERPRNNSQEEDPLHINYRKLLGAKMPGINALQLSEITTRLVLELSDRHLVHEDKLVKIFGSTRPEIVKQAIDLARQELANSGLEIIELSNQTGVAFLLQGELNTGRTNFSEGIGSTLQEGQLQTVNPESGRKRTEIEEIQLLFAGVIITQLSSSATFNGTRFLTLEINPTAFARGHGKEVLEKIRTSMINLKHEDPRSITDDMLKREIVEWIFNGLKMYWDESQLGTVSKDISHNRILNTLKNFVQEQKTKGRTITLEDLTKIISDYFARKEPDGTPSPPGRKYRQPSHGKMKL